MIRWPMLKPLYLLRIEIHLLHLLIGIEYILTIFDDLSDNGTIG
jgi:hypothetical protein